MKIVSNLVRPMIARTESDAHRAATPLELLFDLVSVIAIAAAAAGLHHSIVENHIGTGLISFSMAFFSIWWAWMNFTWFASAYAFGIWFVHERYNSKGLSQLVFPAIGVAILASSYLPMAIPAIALLLIIAVGVQTRTASA